MYFKDIEFIFPSKNFNYIDGAVMCNEETDLYFCHLIIRNILCALPPLLRLLCVRILLLERLRGVSVLWEKEKLSGKGKSARQDRRGRSWGYYVSARIFQLDFFRYSSVSWKPPGLWMGMKIITPAGQAHSPSAIIYRHPLDKALVLRSSMEIRIISLET